MPRKIRKTLKKKHKGGMFKKFKRNLKRIVTKKRPIPKRSSGVSSDYNINNDIHNTVMVTADI